jgi:hypothetical protein
VHRVEPFGVLAREVRHPGRDHLEAGFLEPGVDLPDHVLGYGVGFYDRKGALHCHYLLRVKVSFMTLNQ